MDTSHHRQRWPIIYQTLGRCRIALPDPQSSKHEALNQCCCYAGPASQTVGHNWTSIASTHGSHSPGKPGKPGIWPKKIPCMEKSWNLKKGHFHEKIMEICFSYPHIFQYQNTFCRIKKKSWKNHGICIQF